MHLRSHYGLRGDELRWVRAGTAQRRGGNMCGTYKRTRRAGGGARLLSQRRPFVHDDLPLCSPAFTSARMMSKSRRYSSKF